MFKTAMQWTPGVLLFGMMIYFAEWGETQEPAPYQAQAPAQNGFEKGVDVMARGPVHEAFATPYQDPKQTPGIPKKPPLPLEEMPPAEKPEGDAVWLGGYWSWDDDRADFLWVSGCWRVKPIDKEWVPGYWREVGNVWQWVPGFWSNSSPQKVEQVTYYPEQPAPPPTAAPGEPPGANAFWIPGYYMWNGERYVWRAGYWAAVRPGYVYIPSHYQWTPSGYVFIPGYWDMTIARRGLLYSPVVVDPVVVGPGYVYSPYFAVRDTMVLDTMFVRVSFGAYYYGDYYGPRYAGIGFEPAVVYYRRGYYEPIIVYERWDHRDNPAWFNLQITLVGDRGLGRAPLPPRMITVNNITVVNNFVAPTRTVLAARGERAVALARAERTQIRENARAVHQAMAAERRAHEARAGGIPSRPQSSPLQVHPTTPNGGRAPLTPSANSGSKIGSAPEAGHPSVGGAQADRKTVGPQPLAKDTKKAPSQQEKKKMP